MNRETIAQLIDAISNEDEDTVTETSRVLALEKVRSKLGYANSEALTEVGEVQIKNNDVFVSGKKVGTVNIEDDDAVVEFTDNEGESQTFDDTESLHRYLNGLNEGEGEGPKRRKRAIDRLPDDRAAHMDTGPRPDPNAGDGEVGDYKKHDPRGSKHKDDRMENPKKHDHGHDDPSGKKQDTKKSSNGDLPEDKKHRLKDKLHKDDYKENPTDHDHGHDDKSGNTPISKRASSGENPPDKKHDPRKSEHKDDRMENPKKHDHGLDSEDIKKAASKVKK